MDKRKRITRAVPKDRPFNDGGPDNLIRTCPECSSGDVSWCDISKRPHCNDCGYWGEVNHNDSQHAVLAWNARLAAVMGEPYVSNNVLSLSRKLHQFRYATLTLTKAAKKTIAELGWRRDLMPPGPVLDAVLRLEVALKKTEDLGDLNLAGEVAKRDAILLKMLESHNAPCRPDHHGYCQEHSLEPIEECYVRQARKILGLPLEGVL